MANESEVKPGEEVLLLTWSQEECVEDRWGCVKSVPVKPGRYTIIGSFPESKGSTDPDAMSYQKGPETLAEWSFTIGPPEHVQISSHDGPLDTALAQQPTASPAPTPTPTPAPVRSAYRSNEIRTHS